MEELLKDIERLSELEPSVKREVPDDCDVELDAFLGALTFDQQESLNGLSTEILQVVIWVVVVTSMFASIEVRFDIWSQRSTRRHESLLLPRCCLAWGAPQGSLWSLRPRMRMAPLVISTFRSSGDGHASAVNGSDRCC